jgi:glucose-1-phosphate thymidylyltransferase
MRLGKGGSLMRGIVLAGGTGSRLFPVTLGVNKHLLPVYDKPMIYYPLAVLMLAGVREILVITRSADVPSFKHVLGDGSALGLAIDYRAQNDPRGIAEVFSIGRDFIDGHRVALILGDNIFFGGTLRSILKRRSRFVRGAVNFAYQVSQPEDFGVVRLDGRGKAVEILEKPKPAPSNWAVTGLYFFDEQVSKIAAQLRPSTRGELEITDVNNAYLRAGMLAIQRLGRGMLWLDAGTPETLLGAGQFVQTVETRQGLKIAALEEIAWREGFIDAVTFGKLAAAQRGTPYADYLRRMAGIEA